MQTATQQAIKAILQTDGTLDEQARSRLIKALTAPPTAEPLGDRILRRAEVARRLSCSHRAVDRLAVQGALPKIRLPGRVRAAGFKLSDVETLLSGRAA